MSDTFTEMSIRRMPDGGYVIFAGAARGEYGAMSDPRYATADLSDGLQFIEENIVKDAGNGGKLADANSRKSPHQKDT